MIKCEICKKDLKFDLVLWCSICDIYYCEKCGKNDKCIEIDKYYSNKFIEFKPIKKEKKDND